MHSPSPAEHGSVTAEWALALPAVMIAFAAILVGASAFVSQSRLDHAAADASRMASLGASTPELRQHVATLLGSDVSLAVQPGTQPDIVCVALSSEAQTGLGGIIRPMLTSMSCALAPPPAP